MALHRDVSRGGRFVTLSRRLTWGSGRRMFMKSGISFFVENLTGRSLSNGINDWKGYIQNKGLIHGLVFL